MNNTTVKCWSYLILLLTCLLANITLFAQDLTIDPTFNNMYGGGSFEEFYTCFETTDGGFMLGGKSFDDPITGNINDPSCGGADYWIIKTDADGNTTWDEVYGGSANDNFQEIIQTSDGGYAAVGNSNSPGDCDVPAGNPFVSDAWVVKVDGGGNIQWTSRFGSSQGDNIRSIIETADGNLLVGGDTLSTATTPNRSDYWVAKLNMTTGAVIWDYSFGSPSTDWLNEVRATTDGYYLGGFSDAAGGDRMATHYGSFDFWVVKIDLNGNYVWDRSYGGNASDQLWAMETTLDGGLILGGPSSSDPTVAPNNKTGALMGMDDYWLIKTDANGVIEWDETFGGSGNEQLYSIDVINVSSCSANYILSGNSNSSSDGDFSNPNKGNGDYWLVFVDDSGNLIWENNYGGDQFDGAWDFRRNSDSTYIVGGYTVTSNNGDVPSANFGVLDNWVFKLNCAFDIPDQPDEDICEGESITLSAVTGDCPSCMYQWDANGNNATTKDITVSPLVNTSYHVTVTNATCCEDTTTLNVFVRPNPIVDLGPDTEICPEEIITLDATGAGCTYLWSTNETTPTIDIDMAGTYMVTVTCDYGCMDADTLIVSAGIVPSVDLGNNTTLCAGDSLLLDAGDGGMNYLWSTGATTQTIYGNDETQYAVTVTSVDGCTSSDSMLINFDTVMVVLPNDTTLCPSETLEVSAGNSGCTYLWTGGSTGQTLTISSTGTYTVTVTCGVASCTAVDEIFVDYFIVDSPQNVPMEICDGDSLFVGGGWQFVAGDYSDTYQTDDGCDSIVITNLSINPIYSEIQPMEICEGDSLFVGGGWQFVAGNYPDTLQTVDGCDSIIITDLTINPIYSTNVPIEICEGADYLAGGMLQTMTGTYYDTLMTIDGCDSIIITDLLVHPIYQDTLEIEICNGEEHLAGGMLQTMTGTYYDTLSTVNNCDSVIVTELTVHPTYSETQPMEICEGDSLFVGGDWQFIAGDYPDTLQTVEGCDSIIITELSINPIYSEIQPMEICEGDSLFVGGSWQFVAGNYPDTLQTVDGCDSIIITDLTINPIYSTNVPIEICEGADYLAGGMLQTMTGTYYDTLMTIDGCDSIIITDLLVHPIYQDTLEIEICNGEEHLAGGMLQTMTGTYYDTLSTVNNCDSVIVTELTVHPTYSETQPMEICEGDSLFVGGGWQIIAGNYPDTLQTVEGCDSIIITELSINLIYSEIQPMEICEGDSLFVGGGWQFVAGNYPDTLQTVDGCDSIIITDLTINPIYSTNVPIEICEGADYLAGGMLQTMTGTYYDTLMTIDGCDSIIITDLLVHPIYQDTLEIEICNGEEHLAGGMLQTMTGTYYDTLSMVNNCDSVIVTELTVHPTYSETQPMEICEGDSLFVGGGWQIIAGNYPDTLQTVEGCDSIIITELSINPIYNEIQPMEICEGDSLFVGGGWQFVAGNYPDTLQTIDGCDSIIITDLTINPIYSTNVPIEICEGADYLAGGMLQTVTGTYYDTLMTIDGCDSIIITDLLVHPIYQDTLEIEICNGEEHLAGGMLQTMAGTYYDTLSTVNNCDSVIVTELTVHPTYSETQPMEICDGDSLFVGGGWQFIAGNYPDTLQTVEGCDSIIITELSINSIYSEIQPMEICEGDSLFVGGGWQFVAGNYPDTLQTVDGCDSIIITDLTINPIYSTNVPIEICEGADYLAGGMLQTMTGTYYDTLMTIDGCDSIIITDLLVHPIYQDTLEIEICNGEEHLAGGMLQTMTGTYYDTLSTVNNCDSVIVTELTVHPTYSETQPMEICEGDSLFVGGGWQFVAGNYPDTLQTVDGCDSIIITDLTINPIYSTNVPIEICEGADYLAGGMLQTMTGTYYDTLMTIDGCDSIIITDLLVHPIYQDTLEIEICNGEEHLAGGMLQTMAGTYYDTLSTVNNCDSVIVTELTVHPTYSETQPMEICEGDSLFVGGGWQIIAGNYPDTLQTVEGCDSIIITELSINLIYSEIQPMEICEGDSLFVGGGWQFVAGNYPDTLQTVDGCDSIIITDLTINPIYSTNVPIEICEGADYLAGGMLQTMTGTYYDTLMTIDGCDSIIITDLLVHPIYQDTLEIEICNGEEHLAGGMLQTMAGTYYDTLSTINNCDSVIVTELTVHPTYSETQPMEICDGDSLFVGGGWQFVAGDYPDTLQTVEGCDSIIITELSINPTYSETQPMEICEGDSLFVGGGWQFVAGNYPDTLQTIDGCDSIIITDLTINPIYSTNVPIEICEGADYLAGGMLQTVTGTYYDTLMTIDGCDSIIITDLLVHPIYQDTLEIEICNGEEHLAGGMLQTMTGTYYDTLSTVNNCDSVIVTELTVHPTYSETQPMEICDGDSLFVGGGWQFIAGNYPDTLQTVEGCDSIIITELSINPIYSEIQPMEICEGDSLFVDGGWQFVAGNYPDTLQTVDGCDSIIITDLTINPIYSTNVPIEICEGADYLAGGMLQTMTGTYYDTLMTIDGCDSVIITDLLVHPIYQDTLEVEICNGEEHLAGGILQTMTGTYYDTLSTINNCDSVIVTELTVHPTYSETQPMEICDGDSLFVGGGWQFIAGNYPDTLQTVEGCDSIIITELSINPIYSEIQPMEICEGDSLFVGGGWQFVAGNYPDTLQTVDGCDSIIITDLTINPIYSTNVPIEICEGADYLAGGMLQTMTGTYYDTLMTIDGCDSIIITDLLVHPIYQDTLEIEICNGEEHLAGGMLQMMAGTYYDTLSTVNNCDSVIVTELTVHPTYSETQPMEICEGDSLFVGGGWQFIAGNYSDTLQTIEGCDSIIITELNINPIYSEIQPMEICDGDSLFVGGGWQFVAGDYTDTLQTVDGCDSIVITELVISENYQIVIDSSICIASQLEPDTFLLSSQDGCDSTVIFNYQLIPADSFFFENFTCDPNLVDTIITDAAGMNGDCDSVLVSITTLAPSYEITIDTMTCIASQTNDTIPMLTNQGCDSIIIYNYELVAADTFTFEVFTCDSNMVDTVITDAPGMNGDCDSVLVNITTLAPSYEITIDTMTCIASQTNDTIPMLTNQGCDSIIIYNYELVAADTFTFEIFTCDSNMVDTVITNAPGMNGDCDSILVNITTLAPSYEITIDTTTCNSTQLNDTIPMLTNQGCDSIIIFNYQLVAADTFTLEVFTCDSNMVDTVITDALGMNGDCDSVLVNITTLAPSYEITIDTTTCNSTQLNDTIPMLTNQGCDSIIIYNYELVAADTFTFEVFTCDSNMVDTLITDALGMNGDCDSVLVNITTLAPSYEITIDTTTCNSTQLNDTIPMLTNQGCDSIIIYNYQLVAADTFMFESFTCDSNMVDTLITDALGMNGDCDSVLVNITTLAPSYEITIDTTTCNSTQLNDTIPMLTNQGCDSIIIYNYQLVAADTFMFESFTCDSNMVDTLITDALGMNGDCDSVLVNITTLAPSYEITIDTTTCNSTQLNDTIPMLTNQGCDSIIIYNYELVTADTFTFEVFTCDSNMVDTVITDALGMNGDCDSVLVNITTLAPSYEITIDTTTCNSTQLNDTIPMLTNQGCDSIIIYNYQLVAADTFTFEVFTCDSNMVDTLITDAVGMNGECDSVLVNITTLAPSYEITIDTTTCNSTQLNDTIPMLTNQGCDSIIIYNYELVAADTFTFEVFTCDSNMVDTVITDALGMNGDCDSVLINITTLAPSYEITIDTTTCNSTQLNDTIPMLTNQGCDSIIIYNYQLVAADTFTFEVFTCDSNMVDTLITDAVGMNGECDSVLVNITTLAPSYEITIDTTTCNSTQLNDTIPMLTNQGCDSIIIYNYELVAADTFTFEVFTCDSNMVNTLITDAVGMNGDCDSVLVNITTLAPSYEITIDTTTCNSTQLNDTIPMLTNQGCDSIIIYNYELVAADTFTFEVFTCDSNMVDTLITDAVGMNGDCDSVLVNITTLAPSYEITIDTTTCNSTQLNDTIPMQTNQGCDSIIIYNYELVSADTFTFEVFTCDSNLVNTVITDAVGMNGDCDSVLINITTLAPSYEIIIDTTTCNSTQTADTLFLNSVQGCDSTIIFNYQLVSADTFTFEVFTCDSNLVDTVITDAVGMNGDCDSVLINITTLAPSYEIIIDTTTCNSTQTADTLFLNSVQGCDSTIIFNYQLVSADTFTFEVFTCDSNLVDTVITDAVGMNGDCDSVLINITTLAPSYEITIDTTTCNATQSTDTLFLNSVQGCDSTIIFNYQLVSADTFTFEVFTCDSNLVDTVITDAVGMNGDCDSVLINITTLAPSYEIIIDTTTCNSTQTADTLFLNSVQGCDSTVIFNYQLVSADTFTFEVFTCDSNLVDTVITDAVGMNGDCDSVLINITTLAPSYEITIDTTTCNATQSTDTLFLNSVQGCDSTIIFNYQLVSADTFTFENFTCDSNLVDTVITDAVGMNGECDSVLINITMLAPSYEITIDTTTCNATQTTDTLFLNSEYDCDSIVIYNYQLVAADTFTIETFTCNPNLVDTTITDATGMNGDCDSVLINITSLAPSYEMTIDVMTCNASQTNDTFYLTTQQYDCDSIVIFNYELVAGDTLFVTETTCDSSLIGVSEVLLPGMNGECDTTLITDVTYACDTIFINSLVCNPADTGVVITVIGGSTTIDSISLAPTDTTILIATSCNPLDTGLVLTNTLQNIFDCDSLIFTQTNLLPSSTMTIESTTCDSNQVGITIDTLQNSSGCDSIVINSIVLAEASVDTILSSSCFIDNVGVDTIFEGTNSLGCDSIIVAVVEFDQVMEAFISINDITCFGQQDGSIIIDSIIGGTAPYLYSINNEPFQSTPIYSGLGAGNYTILIEDADGCQTIAIAPVSPGNDLLVDLGDDIFINLGDSVNIHAEVNINEESLDTIMWTPYDSTGCDNNCMDFTVTPYQTTTFSIMVMDENGCMSEDEITIFVDRNVPVYIPNAFSPNGDNINDKITIYGDAEVIQEVQIFRIFDRWGELVYQGENFQPNNPANGWDGKLKGEPMNPAVFVYYAEVRFIDGSVEKFEGDVTLVR